MTDHPITPPPELVQEWAHSSPNELFIAHQAARWGADQELKACCEWLEDTLLESATGLSPILRSDRRPIAPD
jgi:hypothetical protein